MKIQYAYINPTGNITILVVSPVEERFQVEIASRLFEVEKNVEQVGFVNIKDESITLRMAGGEFCGNATISSAALYCFINGIYDTDISVTVSGIPKPVDTTVEYDGFDTYYVSAVMPEPKEIYSRMFTLGGKELELPVVDFGGITHIILDKDKSGLFTSETIKVWASELKSDALGVMIIDRNSNDVTPVVYVRKSDTLYYENSCASGTIAIACYLHMISGNDTDLTLNEPGGSLRVVVEDGAPVLFGKAVIVSENEIEIEIETENQ